MPPKKSSSTKKGMKPERSARLAFPDLIMVRNYSLLVMALLAVIYTLHWARQVLIPLMIGVMISYALSPLVNFAYKRGVPRAIGAAFFLLSIVGGLGYMGYSLSDDAAKLVESLPQAAQKLRQTLNREHGLRDGAIDKVQKAATQLERAASESTPTPPTPSGVTRVQIEKPKININDYLWAGTMGTVGAIAQISIVLFLAYFLMASGDTFRRKLVLIAGPTHMHKKITLQVLNDIDGQIQRYMLVTIFTSILVGVATWLAYLWVGLEHAAIWGIAAGVFNSIPYLGPIVVTGGTSMVGLLQFGTLEMGLLVGGISLVITSLEGYLLTPWLTSRTSRMNAVVVFMAVLFWGWLWGAWGLLLGIPILMIIKAICDRVDDLKPISELLSE